MTDDLAHPFFAAPHPRVSGCMRCGQRREHPVHDVPTPAAMAGICPGCREAISPRYLTHGVCRDCYGTTDDPQRDGAVPTEEGGR